MRATVKENNLPTIHIYPRLANFLRFSKDQQKFREQKALISSRCRAETKLSFSQKYTTRDTQEATMPRDSSGFDNSNNEAQMSTLGLAQKGYELTSVVKEKKQIVCDE